MTTGPSTVLKALSLLDYFSEQRPAIGLSTFAKLSGFNKATTLRFLVALESKGFVEQNEESRMYNLGPAFLRFSQLREASFPLTEAVMSVLRDLNAATGETSHASIRSGNALATIGVVESTRANRVIVEMGEALPLHATASGLIYLAFSEQAFVSEVLAQPLASFTPDTLTQTDRIRDCLANFRKTAIAHAPGSYEEDVLGIAAAFFEPGGAVCGTVATALPNSRATDAHIARIEAAVTNAANRLSHMRGASGPPAITEPEETP